MLLGWGETRKKCLLGGPITKPMDLAITLCPFLLIFDPELLQLTDQYGVTSTKSYYADGAWAKPKSYSILRDRNQMVAGHYLKNYIFHQFQFPR